ncbi:unannotated protein [freshwater metagenome]|uniref:Unannotated protein n=1 Tax=freshwater metagenome TaxID=449393 RepID=A0A6J7U1D8_9ZZZZ
MEFISLPSFLRVLIIDMTLRILRQWIRCLAEMKHGLVCAKLVTKLVFV